MMSKSLPDLSIVIPAYKEESRIGKTLEGLAVYLKTASMRKYDVEVLVVAADSNDNTQPIALSYKDKFDNLKLLKPGAKVGKGRDVAFGMNRAQGKAIVFMDADTATPLWHIDQFYQEYIAGQDVIIGTRNLLNHHPDISRRLLSKMGNIAFKCAVGIWLEDSQCGFKMFSKEASRLCFSNLSILGWGFDMEVLAIAKANNLKIKAIRIDDWVSVPNGTFTESIAVVAIRSFIELAHIARNRFLGKYIKT